MAPSPSPAIFLERVRHTASRAPTKASYSGPSWVISGLPAAPFAKMAKVSLVEVSPSMEIMLKVASVTWWMAFCSMAGLMAQSVVTKHSMVAMLGWIMPLPLEMPPTFTALPPSSTWAAASLGRVSVVIMAVAAPREPSGLRDFASAGTPWAMGSMGSTWPMTPVEATTTSWGEIPKAWAAKSHMAWAFSTPSALQVLALPELQITAWAKPFFQVFLRHQDGRALDQVPGVHRRRRAGTAAVDHGQVGFCLVLTDAAVDAPGHKSLCRRDAAFDHFHRSLPLSA